MAIVDGKRWRGWTFYKVRGKWEYVAYYQDSDPGMIYGLCASIEEGADPMRSRFHYCSPVSQPVFIDGSAHRGLPDREHYIPTSWRKMPACWRAIFRRDLFYLTGDDGEALPPEEQPAPVPEDAEYYEQLEKLKEVA